MAEAFERGTFANGTPYLRLEGGPRLLAFFLPLYSSILDFRKYSKLLRWFFKPYLATHTVLMLGRRAALPGGYTLEAMAEDCAPAVAATLKRLGQRRADVLGMSLGGLIAFHFAAVHPTHVRKLAVVAAGEGLGEEVRLRLPAVKARVNEGKWFHPLWTMVDLNFTWPLRPLLFTMILLGAPAYPFLRLPTRDFLVSVEAVERMTLGKALSRIRCPALVIGGAKDRIFPAPMLVAAARRIKNSRTVIITGAGHNSFVENRKAFQKVILDFFG